MGLFSRKKDVGELKAKRDFAGLADVIKKDDDQREAAADALVELDDPAAVGALVGVMWDLRTGKEDREAAERVIRELGPDKTLDPLIDSVRDGQLGALYPLVEIGEDAVIPHLEEILASDPGEYETEAKYSRACDVAQRVLLELDSDRSLGIFAEEFRAGGPRARSAVGNAYTPWEGNDPRVVKGILFAFADENESARKFADRAMDNLLKRMKKGKVEVGPPLEAIVEVMADRSEPEAARAKAALLTGDAVKTFASELPDRATELIAGIVHDAGEVPEVRNAAAVALLLLCEDKKIERDDERVLEVLTKAAEDSDQYVRWPAGCALGMLYDRRSTPILSEIMIEETTNDYYLGKAKKALNRTLDPEAYSAVRWQISQNSGNHSAVFATELGVLRGKLEQEREKAGITEYKPIELDRG